jgi:ABC-type transport system involved in multi-copper enzyme maturation permease subunit
VIAWSLRRGSAPDDFLEDIILPLYVSFLLPVFCLCFATPSIAGDREEGTLVYLIAAPLPRPLLYASKFLATAVITSVWTLGGLLLLCLLAGESGWLVMPYVGPTAGWATLAYVSLFHLFSAVFRRATIVALGYALFFEAFVANVPGIVKRVAISFYAHCAIFAAAEPLGMGPAGPRDPELYQPVSGDTATSGLAIATLVLFLAGAWLFTRREYS